MWLTKPNTQIAIGLIVFGIAMTTNAQPFHWNEYLQLMRELQFVATLGLAFGIFKAHSKHTDKFLLLWLVITAFCFLSLLNAGLMHWCQHLRYGSGSFIWTLLPWTFAAGVAYLWNIIYKDYVELKFGADDPVDKDVVTPEQTPSKYPNPESLTILVHGKRMK
ncbi:uncharacterized protein LOC117785190 [Drosophila innubila]|uniref:uncharacterized protein LOC117785190 n=1 Tax=Drosophila innubila TaxID=198719 RepID=UPI00148D270F|nr:uncharacterized protein LOC117785190 [Drosophila innubila]